MIAQRMHDRRTYTFRLGASSQPTRRSTVAQSVTWHFRRPRFLYGLVGVFRTHVRRMRRGAPFQLRVNLWTCVDLRACWRQPRSLQIEVVGKSSSRERNAQETRRPARLGGGSAKAPSVAVIERFPNCLFCLLERQTVLCQACSAHRVPECFHTGSEVDFSSWSGCVVQMECGASRAVATIHWLQRHKRGLIVRATDASPRTSQIEANFWQ